MPLTSSASSGSERSSSAPATLSASSSERDNSRRRHRGRTVRRRVRYRAKPGHEGDKVEGRAGSRSAARGAARTGGAEESRAARRSHNTTDGTGRALDHGADKAKAKADGNGKSGRADGPGRSRRNKGARPADSCEYSSAASSSYSQSDNRPVKLAGDKIRLIRWISGGVISAVGLSLLIAGVFVSGGLALAGIGVLSPGLAQLLGMFIPMTKNDGQLKSAHNTSELVNGVMPPSLAVGTIFGGVLITLLTLNPLFLIIAGGGLLMGGVNLGFYLADRFS